MKIAIITDVHGNYPALKAALAEIDKVHVSHVYCLGDMIAIGPDSNQVLATLFNRKDVSMITGNHDEGVLALIKGQPHPMSHKDVERHHQWIAERLDPSFVEKLAVLPRVIETSLLGHSVLFTHYHIRQGKLNAPFYEDPLSPIVQPSLENMENLFKDCQQELICFGHHHPLHYFRGKHSLYLNPGSLGCASEPYAPYAIVTLTPKKIEINLRKAAYDNRNFLASYKRLNVPDGAFLIKAFHGNQSF
ncbi:metallophosphoesterase family protein [Sporolactobacillus laevolacticus]|uniref:metallophosphoesterase family protein n=1 Tax=Sporolactobacillus laevolacticus TaxID=33018 RepID=UPI0025B5C5E3|nr:metallophosphoesterase family protein [Sporolactobacillus laevolacticus]MDN3956053.1 metallophosphoesterase family protein [Sporolactobacillus laevolacticus]